MRQEACADLLSREFTVTIFVRHWYHVTGDRTHNLLHLYCTTELSRPSTFYTVKDVIDSLTEWFFIFELSTYMEFRASGIEQDILGCLELIM